MLQQIQAVLKALRLLAHQPYNRTQARQRGAHFMRHVVQQAPLPLHQLIDVMRHAVEIPTQIGQLVASTSHRLRDIRRQLPGRSSEQRLPQPPHRPGDVGGEKSGEDKTDDCARQQVQQR